MLIQQGKQALVARRLTDASRFFEQAAKQSETRAQGLLGLAHTALLEQNIDRAERYVQTAQQMKKTPDTMLYQAMILGERGRRSDAYTMLAGLKDLVTEKSFALALLAEQRIRQGYWKEGTDLLVLALKIDTNNFAMAHLREIFCDMSEAIEAGKIPPQEPLKMLNMLDYSTPQTTSPFFATIRRYLSQGEVVPRSIELPSQAQTTSAPAAQAQPQRPAPPAEPQRPISTPQMSHSAPSIHERTAKQLTRPAEVKSAFRQSMLEERNLNEKLQEKITPLATPQWPSAQTTPIDQIPIIEPSQRSVSERLKTMEQHVFHITQGNIFVQLYMERCFDALVRQIPTEITGSLALTPSLASLLQLNLADEFLSTDLNVITSDLTEITTADHGICALAYFIGESFARRYKGTWSYTNNPTQVQVKIGSQAISPYALAQQWVGSSKYPDPSSIYRLVQEFEQQQTYHMDANSAHDYIDLTEGLSQQALSLKLAELWSFYCVRHARTSFMEIARKITILESDERFIIFDIDQSICPKPIYPSGRKPNANTLSMAYCRITGEFLMLSYPSGLTRVLGSKFGMISSDNAANALRFIQKYHAPGGNLIENAAEAQQSKHAQLGVSAPTLQRMGAHAALLNCWIIEPQQRARQLELKSVRDPESGLVIWSQGA